MREQPQGVPWLRQTILSALLGLIVYVVCALAWPRLSSGTGDVGTSESNAHFARKYKAATEADLASALETCRQERHVRQQRAVDDLLHAGNYEIVCADPAGLALAFDQQLNSAWSISPLDSQIGLYNKVLIRRGFDPELDLLIEECEWIKDAISQSHP